MIVDARSIAGSSTWGGAETSELFKSWNEIGFWILLNKGLTTYQWSHEPLEPVGPISPGFPGKPGLPKTWISYV